MSFKPYQYSIGVTFLDTPLGAPMKALLLKQQEMALRAQDAAVRHSFSDCVGCWWCKRIEVYEGDGYEMDDMGYDGPEEPPTLNVENLERLIAGAY